MIPSFNTSSALFFLCLVFFLSLCNTKVRSLTTYYCPNTTTYTPSSTYQSNLNYLFSVLSSNSTNINGFYHFTAGLSPPDIAYGLFLCRGDISTDSCQDCVAGATKEIIQLCPNQKSAMIWHGNCFLRFSNQSMFSIADQSISLILYNTQNVTEPNRFEEVLGVVMNDVVSRASNSWSGKKFATKEANFTSNQTLYGLAQCTPDVSGSDCNTCLRNALSNLPNCCGGKQGARVLLPSCSIRYEVYPFNNPNNNAVYAIYNATAPPPSPVVRPPPTGPTSSPGSKVKKMTITISISSLIVVALLGSCIYYHKRKIIEKGERFGDDYNCENFQREKHTKSQDFPSIQLDLIRVATNYFSKENKLGEGGFGPVYKGTLLDGKEIAVKRLSRTSDQGLQELKNEVTLIAKLQHRNLVKLLGCCLEGNESLLIYEYMPNKSLDVFLFDSTKGGQLDWKRRFLIINGVAKGLLYLHEDSRLRIIHRDLKTSNVLLDHEMNPKISDFGMARIFCGNQIEANTNRIVGTYGYMAPEYAMEGLFSIKSDVFSFGVLLLEMISGKRNSGFYLSDHGHSLLTFAWKLWSEGQGLELMDPLLVRSCVVVEVSKCIQIGLLCVQEDAADRPTMSSVVVMLRSDTTTLPRPTQPAFSVGRLVMKSTQASPNVKLLSVNEITLSDVSPR